MQRRSGMPCDRSCLSPSSDASAVAPHHFFFNPPLTRTGQGSRRPGSQTTNPWWTRVGKTKRRGYFANAGRKEERNRPRQRESCNTSRVSIIRYEYSGLLLSDREGGRVFYTCFPRRGMQNALVFLCFSCKTSTAMSSVVNISPLFFKKWSLCLVVQKIKKVGSALGGLGIWRQGYVARRGAGWSWGWLCVMCR